MLHHEYGVVWVMSRLVIVPNVRFMTSIWFQQIIKHFAIWFWCFFMSNGFHLPSYCRVRMVPRMAASVWSSTVFLFLLFVCPIFSQQIKIQAWSNITWTLLLLLFLGREQTLSVNCLNTNSTLHAPPETSTSRTIATVQRGMRIIQPGLRNYVENAWKQKIRKAPGPDNISPTCLKVCADQLSPIITQIFKRSLELCEVSSYVKRSRMHDY